MSTPTSSSKSPRTRRALAAILVQPLVVCGQPLEAAGQVFAVGAVFPWQALAGVTMRAVEKLLDRGRLAPSVPAIPRVREASDTSLVARHPEILDELGKTRDVVLAHRYGVTQTTIWNIRKRHEIPRYTRSAATTGAPSKAMQRIERECERERERVVRIEGELADERRAKLAAHAHMAEIRHVAEALRVERDALEVALASMTTKNQELRSVIADQAEEINKMKHITQGAPR